MKAKIGSDALRAALKGCTEAASGGVEPKAALAVAGFGQGALRFKTTDLSVWAESSVPAECWGAGEVLVLADRLAGAVEYLPAGEEVLLTATDDVLSVKCGGYEADLRLDAGPAPASDPPLPLEGSPSCVMAGELWRSLLGRASKACHKRDGRYVMSSVCLERDGQRLSVAATDSHRVSAEVAPPVVSLPESFAQALVPARAVKVLEKSAVSGDVRATFGRSSARFEGGNFAVTALLPEGKFPPWREVMKPSSGDPSAKWEGPCDVPAGVLLTALRQASSLGESRVEFSLASGALILRGDQEEGGRATAELKVGYSGPGVRTTLDPSQLADFLKGCDAQDLVQWRWTAGDRPSLFRRGDWRWLVMPLTPRG